MNILNYLPSTDEVNECIKPEAENTHEAILLAVHRPSKLSYRFLNRQDSIPTTEQELLDHVLTKDVPTGSLVVPITGISGVGKSHLVRILHAGLRQRADSNRFLIVRIPKSASLRKVVQLILDLLPQDDRFAEVRIAFDRAMADVDMESATIDFRSCLIVALEQRSKSLGERYAAGEAGLNLELDHARRVHLLFDDPVTGAHFRQTIFPRIVKRAVSGGTADDSDGLSGQFRSEDFFLPASIKLGEAATVTQKYYNLAINQANGRGREVAAKVLNGVVDEATSRLFKLHDSLGGMTLQEVILEIRRVLLQEKKELLLFIEDFGALTGIQETLSKVLIQEGVRDNQQVYATMRSVIAVTDGWTIGRDTFSTRAEREWIIQSQIDSQEEVLDLTRAMVAAYLNAARYGHSELIKQYVERRPKSQKQWFDVYRSDQDDDATENLLQAFGYHDSIPLFPFTLLAIERLARIALTDGQRLIFRPRYIINQILRSLLLTARELFESQEFPPIGLDPRLPSAAMAAVVNAQPEALRPRYATVLTVWGNAPQDLDGLSAIPSGIFQAFSLPAPVNIGSKPKPTADRTRTEEKKSATPLSQSSSDPKLALFKSALETWIQENRLLPQEHAAKIRTLVATALNQHINLNVERCVGFSIEANQISVPNAGGEKGISAAPIVLSDDPKDRDGRLRSSLIALYRLNEAQQRKEIYEESDEDLARVLNLVDRLMTQALTIVRNWAAGECCAIAVPLAMSARVLGLGDVMKSPSGVRRAFLHTIETTDPGPSEEDTELSNWRAFRAECQTSRLMLQSKIMNACGCFQGSSRKTVLAVDITRLVAAYERSLESKDDRSSAETFSSEELQAVRSLAEPKVRQRAHVLLNKFRPVCKSILSELGEGFDKNAVLATVGELADMLKSGNWDTDRIGMSFPAFTNLCDSFRSLAVKDSLSQFADATTAEQSASRFIARIAQVNFIPLVVSDRFVKAASSLAAFANQQAELLERQYGDVDPGKEAAGINTGFADVIEMLESEVGGGKNGVT
jgi:hypothetical protein